MLYIATAIIVIGSLVSYFIYLVVKRISRIF